MLLTFGRALRLPGEFFEPTPTIRDAPHFVKQLQEAFGKIRSVPFRNRVSRNIFVHRDLWTCKRVYVRVDKVKIGLESPYDGPYEVVKRGKKYFHLRIKGIVDPVSIDRLKPAHEINVDNELVVENTLPKPILKSPNLLSNVGFPPCTPENPNESKISGKAKKKVVIIEPPTCTKSGRKINRPARYR